MNAPTIPSVAAEALALAASNEAILRALDPAPIAGDSAVAHAAGVAAKNVGRQLKLLHSHDLVERLNGSPTGWNLTQAGRRALSAIDLANGRLSSTVPPADAGEASPAVAGPPAVGDVLHLTHDQLRPNPLQPRKTFDTQELEELKATIVSAGRLLHNLVVFPPDPDGLHMISDGERRWRAVGELIAENMWDATRPLAAVPIDNTPGQAAFIGLVANGQGKRLPLWEAAQAYAELCRETGWSARHAALQTGRDIKSVQQMLQVVTHATPANIARFHDADDAYGWEDLRRSVQQPREAGEEGAGREGEQQLDIEGAAALPYTLDDHALGLIDYHKTNVGKLKPRALMMLVELADKVLREPIAGHPLWTAVAEEHLGPGMDSDFILAGAGFQGRHEGRPIASIAASTLEALRVRDLLTATGDRPAILERVRASAGVSPGHVREAANLNMYITPWLDPDWAPGRKPTPTGAHVVNGIDYGNATRAAEARRAAGIDPPLPKPNTGGGAPREAVTIPTAYDPSTRPLTSLEALALAELAHATSAASGNCGWTRVWAYWRDLVASDLRADGLIDIRHSAFADGPEAQLTGRGLLHLIALGLNMSITDDQLRSAQAEVYGERQDRDGPYWTPWLNEPAADDSSPRPQADPGEGDHEVVEGASADEFDELDYAKSNADLDDEEFVTAELLLGDVATALDDSDDFDPIPLLARAAVTPMFKLTDEGVTITDAGGEPILELSGQGDLPADLLKARALLIVTSLNAALTDWTPDEGKRRTTADPASPAVPIRRSITPETITCLEDGGRFISLTRHLFAAYGLTPNAYRARWRLPRDYPMVAPNEMWRRQRLMQDNGVEVPDHDEDDGAPLSLTREAYVAQIADLLLERDDIEERVQAIDLAEKALSTFLAKHDLEFGDPDEDWELIQDDIYGDVLEGLRSAGAVD